MAEVKVIKINKTFRIREDFYKICSLIEFTFALEKKFRNVYDDVFSYSLNYLKDGCRKFDVERFYGVKGNKGFIVDNDILAELKDEFKYQRLHNKNITYLGEFIELLLFIYYKEKVMGKVVFDVDVDFLGIREK